ncbi:MAG: hypothetical protein HZB16_14225 [Armatimonadetes bacterium]|nr:hypothetical protein [Armatimonadota bacterium]
MRGSSLVLLLAACSLAGALTVKVDATAGAPRLLVNGQPKRARMFYGGPASSAVKLPAAGGPIDEVFTALGDEPRIATMHFRFGHQRGRVVIDDLKVTDLEAGRVVLAADFEDGQAAFGKHFATWPTDATNTVARCGVEPGVGRDGSAGLRMEFSAPPGGNWPDWHLYAHNLALVKGHRYRLQLWAKAEPEREVRIAFYRPGTMFVYLGGPGDLFSRQIRLAGASGADFVTFPMGLPWPKEAGEQPNWDSVDGICEMVLTANPKALLIPRIGLDAPAWWLAAHPDEAMKWDAGTHSPHAVPCSPLYQTEALRNLDALIRHLEQRFPDQIAGFHPSGQNTGEWFYEDTWGNALNGYAPADQAGFRRYLGDDTATVPTPEQRRATPAGLLRDPVAERRIVEFGAFQQQAMADWVCAMARTIKAAAPNKLTVFFYGYIFEFGAIGNGPAISGHYALRRALDCPQIDVLCSPISYFDRQAGGSGPVMTAAESVALAGKMWLCEDDTRTYLVRETGFPGDKEGANTLEDTQQLLRRNVAQEATRNLATWWMDLGSTGWFNDPKLWADMTAFAALDTALMTKPTPYRPQVAAVLDEASVPRLANGAPAASRGTIYESRAALGRMGAPYGQYLQDDLAAGRIDAKLVVLLSSYVTDAAQRAKLKTALGGKARVWCWAPGYYDGWQVSPTAMAELTGFRLLAVTPGKAIATPTPAGTAWGLTKALGPDRAIRPLYAVADATPAETLATYADGSAAIVARQTPDGLSVFVGPPALSSELLRATAARAGVHLYTRTDCQVYANGPFTAIHAAQAGTVALTLPAAGPVFDALTGARVGQGPALSFDLALGETRVLRVGQ